MVELTREGQRWSNSDYRPPTKGQLYLYRKPVAPAVTALYRKPEGAPSDRLASRVYSPFRRPRHGYLEDRTSRLLVAAANNNGGAWWVATSSYRVPVLERLFYEEKAPRLLYEVVGGLCAHPSLSEEGLLFVQLARIDELVEVCLEDLRIRLQGEVPKSDVVRCG